MIYHACIAINAVAHRFVNTVVAHVKVPKARSAWVFAGEKATKAL